MKLTNSQLKRIINEEIQAINEQREAEQIIAEVQAFQEALDAGTLEKGAAAAGKVADALAKLVANPTAKKWLSKLLYKIKLGAVAEFMMELTPEDIQGLKSLGAAAGGQLDKVAKTVAVPAELARTTAFPAHAGPDELTVAVARE